MMNAERGMKTAVPRSAFRVPHLKNGRYKSK
jgi:hypothetical protein